MQPRQLHLDGLRGLAILVVVVWHSVSSPLGYENRDSQGHFPTGPLAFAWAGVDVFFALSGYLITDILLKARNAPNYFVVFLLRRLCRLLPLYLLVLGSYFLARHFFKHDPILGQFLHRSGIPDWTLFLGLQNNWMAWKTSFGPAWLAPTWSLAAEWQFYWLWAMAIRWLPRSGLWFVTLAVLIASPGVRGLLSPIVGYVTLLGRADSFLAGSLAALVLASNRSRKLLEAYPNVLTGLLLVALATLGLMLFNPIAFGAVTPWYGTFTHSLIACTTGLLIVRMTLHEQSWFTRLARTSPLVGLGTISYGVYLLHQPLRYGLFWYYTGGKPELQTASQVWVTILAAGCSVLLATVLYLTLERAFIKLGRRVDYSKRDTKRTAEAAAPSNSQPQAV